MENGPTEEGVTVLEDDIAHVHQLLHVLSVIHGCTIAHQLLYKVTGLAVAQAGNELD